MSRGVVTREAVAERVQVWTIEHEARANAVSPAMLDEMREACSELRGEVVVLTAVGERGFCSGFDLRALRQSPEPAAGVPDRALIEMTDAMASADAVFIGALFGHVIGAGVELACACDLRLGRADTSFLVPAARLGVVYHARGLSRIHGAVGSNGARRLLLAGGELLAADLERAGALQICERPLQDALSLASTISKAPLESVIANRKALAQLDSGRPLSQAFVAGHEQARAAAYMRLKNST